MILTIYFIKRLLVALLVVTAGVYILTYFFEFEAQLSKLTNLGVSKGEVAKLVAMITPERMERLIPGIFGIAALWASLRTSRTNEAIIIRAAGTSGIFALARPALAVLCIGFVMITILGPINARLVQSFQIRVSELEGKQQQIFIENEGYFWFRQVLNDQQAILKATITNQGQFYEGLHIFIFDKNNAPSEHIYAETAELLKDISINSPPDGQSGSGLCFYDYKISSLNRNNQLQRPKTGKVDCFNSKLTVEKINESVNSPGQVSIWRLPSLIELLEYSGFSTSRYQLHFHMQLAKPILFATMVLIGGGFTMRHSRAFNTAMMVIVAILCILTVIFIQQFTKVMGEVETIHYAVAAWAPPIAALFIAVGLLSYLESK